VHVCTEYGNTNIFSARFGYGIFFDIPNPVTHTYMVNGTPPEVRGDPGVSSIDHIGLCCMHSV